MSILKEIMEEFDQMKEDGCWDEDHPILKLAEHNDQLKKSLVEAVGLLGAADCPQCKDKSGAHYDNNGNVCQCQWCDEVQSLNKRYTA